MTDAELRALAEAATPGPWRSRKWPSPRMVEVIAPGVPPIVPWTGFDESARTKAEHDANADYIAAACNAILGLLDRADAAEAQVAALLQDKAAAHARAEEREAEIDALTGQVAALVEALITAVSALENYGDHHEWCAKQYCTCGYGGYLIEGHRLLSDLSAAAAEPSTPSAAAARLAW